MTNALAYSTTYVHYLIIILMLLLPSFRNLHCHQFVPLAVLAALAGAIPFIGAYWVAMPAVLELWLLQGSLLSALALFALSVLPVFFVDTLINREIEG